MGRKVEGNRETLEGKNFLTVIYPDSESYDCNLLLNRLEAFGWDHWFYILHDKDFYSELDKDRYETRNKEPAPFKVGDLKKPHYHIIGCMDSSRTLSNAANKFGVPSNMVERVKNLKDSVVYLTHRKYPETEKYHYTEDQIITNDSKMLEKLLTEQMGTTEKAKLLFDYIYNPECISLTVLAQFAITHDCWDELRRGQHIYTSLMNERIKNK